MTPISCVPKSISLTCLSSLMTKNFREPLTPPACSFSITGKSAALTFYKFLPLSAQKTEVSISAGSIVGSRTRNPAECLEKQFLIRAGSVALNHNKVPLSILAAQAEIACMSAWNSRTRNYSAGHTSISINGKAVSFETAKDVHAGSSSVGITTSQADLKATTVFVAEGVVVSTGGSDVRLEKHREGIHASTATFAVGTSIVGQTIEKTITTTRATISIQGEDSLVTPYHEMAAGNMSIPVVGGTTSMRLFRELSA